MKKVQSIANLSMEEAAFSVAKLKRFISRRGSFNRKTDMDVLRDSRVLQLRSDLYKIREKLWTVDEHVGCLFIP